jgi:hypothetical protein
MEKNLINIWKDTIKKEFKFALKINKCDNNMLKGLDPVLLDLSCKQTRLCIMKYDINWKIMILYKSMKTKISVKNDLQFLK